MGELIYKVPPVGPPHIHDTPYSDFEIDKGDVWRCECGEMFKCEGRDYGKSQVQFRLIWRQMSSDQAIRQVFNT